MLKGTTQNSKLYWRLISCRFGVMEINRTCSPMAESSVSFKSRAPLSLLFSTNSVLISISCCRFPDSRLSTRSVSLFEWAKYQSSPDCCKACHHVQPACAWLMPIRSTKNYYRRLRKWTTDHTFTTYLVLEGVRLPLPDKYCLLYFHFTL